MEAASLAFSVAQTFLAALQSDELHQICSLWGVESELDSLKDTVTTIKSVLLDADAKDVLNHQQLNYVHKLKHIVYDADDLLDEFAALALKQQHLLDSGKVSNKVRLLFSRFGKLGVLRKMSKNVKKIRKQLDDIATNAHQFCFKVDYEPIRRRREDSCSYVYENDVIGREKETQEIVDMLLAPSADDVSVLAIVGIGGLGKTTLAQLVYDHEKVKSAFSPRLWACDGDQDQLLVQPILAKVLESATGNKQDGSGIEVLQRQVRELLQGKKYLLILDDVWTENRNGWLNLKKFFNGGMRGSRILITTRLKKTSQAVGSIDPYMLQGLTEDNSWRLFERVAFEGSDHEQREDQELVNIGKEIVKKCSNVPLSIRVVGSLLHGQEKKNWLKFQQCEFTEIIKEDHTLMRILKLSYHHLQPAMKSCFTFCALFPKDSTIAKKELISLWMAQGYIETIHEGQSIEDVAEDYFLILVRRCFFQEIKNDKYGEIVSYKMHDLIHDMAQQLASKEISVLASSTRALNKNTRHVNHVSYTRHHFHCETKIRTYLSSTMVHTFPEIKTISRNWSCLRVLALKTKENKLPDSIGNHLHLRYIDLSSSINLEKLPESITQLCYLQTLILKDCHRLTELPKDLNKLRMLRILDINRTEIEYMPSGMDKLTNLSRLSSYIVSAKNIEPRQCVGSVEDLRPLKELRGYLRIKFRENFRYVKGDGCEGAYLINKSHLNAITIDFRGVVDVEIAWLDDLQPHENLKRLEINGYSNEMMPRWVTGENLKTYLPNLVEISLWDFCELQELPLFSKLQHLKCLSLSAIGRVKHMEGILLSEEGPFFPSLEEMWLQGLEELEGWWKGSVPGVVDGSGNWPSFPRLLKLSMRNCPKLKSIPFCPAVETSVIKKCNECVEMVKEECCSGEGGDSGSWRRVKIDSLRCLYSLLPPRLLQSIQDIRIYDDDMESFLINGEVVFGRCLSSVRSLTLWNLKKLKNIRGGGWEHLTALESLDLWHLNDFSFNEEEEEEEEEGSPWRSLGQSLRSLSLQNLPKVVKLPKGMKHLTSLQSLYISNCKIGGLPKWIGCLSSLQSLTIGQCEKIESLPGSMRQLTTLKLYDCSEGLQQRCRRPDGEDWPIIQHIPNLTIS